MAVAGPAALRPIAGRALAARRAPKAAVGRVKVGPPARVPLSARVGRRRGGAPYPLAPAPPRRFAFIYLPPLPTQTSNDY